MPLYSIFILFQLPTYLNYRYPSSYFLAIYGLVSINLILFPLVFSLYLKKNKMIQSLKMATVEERVLPYAFSVVMYLITYYLFYQIQFPSTYLNVFLGATMALISLLVFAFFKQKISAHLAGLGGLVGLLLVVNLLLGVNTLNLMLIGLILSGVVASARFLLNAHKLWQLLLGFLIGFSCQVILLL